MKQLAILLLCIAMIACKDKPAEKPSIDKNATIALSSNESKAENPLHKSPRFIVDSTSAIQVNGGAMGFSDKQRDIVNNRLLLWGFQVITQSGELELRFITSRDVVFEHWWDFPNPGYFENPHDTIAYIPNAILEKAEAEIRAAYDSGDYETVYTLFQDAYTFYPITGAEWRALKAQGIE